MNDYLTIHRKFLMPRITRYLIISCLAIIASGCTTLQYANMEKPVVTLVSMELAGLTWAEQRFDIGLRIVNPNDLELPITGLNYDLRLNGLKLGSGGSDGDLRIPALGEKVVQIKLTTAAWVWFRQYRQLRQSEGGVSLDNLKYQINGKVFLEGLAVKSLPFEKVGDIALTGKN